MAQGKHPISGVKFDLVSAWAGLGGEQAPAGDDHMAGVVLEGGTGELEGGLEHIDLDRLEAMAAGIGEGREDGGEVDAFGWDVLGVGCRLACCWLLSGRCVGRN